jgi:hypothetical protein
MGALLYNAFGDESVGPNYASYGVILVAADKQDEANSILKVVKARHGASADDLLHCRILFSGQQRQKSPWAALSMSGVFDLYSDLMHDLNPLLVRKIVALGKSLTSRMRYRARHGKTQIPISLDLQRGAAATPLVPRALPSYALTGR